MKLNKRLQIALIPIGCVAIVAGTLWLTSHYPLIASLIAVVCLVIAILLVEKESKEWKKFQEKED